MLFSFFQKILIKSVMLTIKQSYIILKDATQEQIRSMLVTLHRYFIVKLHGIKSFNLIILVKLVLISTLFYYTGSTTYMYM